MNEINELAEFICDAGIALDGVDFAYKSDHFERLATALINAGYRKQSNTVKEFAEKLNRKAEVECDSDFNISIYNLEALAEALAAEFGETDIRIKNRVCGKYEEE